jgi:hypothetical protein
MAGPGDFYDPLAPQPIPVPSADPFADLRPTWEQFLASQIAAAEPAPPPVPVAPPPDLGEMPADVVAAAPVDPYAPAFGQPGIGVPTEAVDQVAATVPQQVPQVPDYSPPFLSDAIEGAAQLANDKTTGGYAGPLDLDPNAPQASLEQREGHRFGQMSTEDLLEDRANRDRVKREMEAAEMLRLATADRENAEAEEKAWRTSREQAAQKRAEVEAEAAKLSDDHTGDWMDEVGTGRTIGAFIAVALGGLVQHLNGGRNSGMDQINLQIDRYVSERRKNLQDKRQGVADLQQQADEDFRVGTTLRVATYERGIREITAKQAAFDVQGAAFNDLEMQKRQLAAAQQQALIAQEEKDRKRLFDETKAKMDMAKTAAEINKLQAEEAKIRGKIGGGGGVKADDVVLTPEQWAARGVQGVPSPMSMKELKKLQPLIRGGTEIAKAGEELNKIKRENSPEERARKFAVGEITYDDGAPVEFRNEGGAEKVAELKGAADFAVQLVDRMGAARKTYGWSSDLIKSPEWREIQADFSQFQLEKKNVDMLGVLAGPDLELINKSIGTSDPTEMRDPTPGFKRVRANMVEKVNSTVRAQAVTPPGRKLKRWSPADIANVPDSRPLVRGTTSAEKAADSELPTIALPFSFKTNEERMSDAENATSTPTGLDPEDDAAVVKAVKDAAKGDGQSLQRLVDVSMSDRSAVRNSVLARIQGESPDVYAKVLAQMPEDVREERKRFDEAIGKIGAGR